jgi:hypothetical protein
MVLRKLSGSLCVCVLAVGTVQAALTGVKDSADFTFKYEAVSGTPEVEVPAQGWSLVDTGAPGNSFAAAGGILSYSTTEQSGGRWYWIKGDDAGSAWNLNVNAATSYTVEFSAKVTASDGPHGGLNLAIGNSAQYGWFNIGVNSVTTTTSSTPVVLADGIDNASDFHTFRVAFDSSAGTFAMWRDNILVSGAIAPDSTFNAPNYLAFGDASSQGSGTIAIDFCRWDATGAFAPVPEPMTLSLLVVGGCWLRRRTAC